MYGNGTIWYQLEESNPKLNLNSPDNNHLLNSKQNNTYINPISSNSSQNNDIYVSKANVPNAVEEDNSRREDENLKTESSSDNYLELNIKLDCPLGKGIKFAD